MVETNLKCQQNNIVALGSSFNTNVWLEIVIEIKKIFYKMNNVIVE